MKLINAGRILENAQTLEESRVPAGELPGSVITMHVVVRPPPDKSNANRPYHFLLAFINTFFRAGRTPFRLFRNLFSPAEGDGLALIWIARSSASSFQFVAPEKKKTGI
ncbi:Membrane-anchored ubiquitin-fold protein 3 [Platanthera guangdongensis]|uniref:Membrane-anchored ubiquitin-fold protein 3 n=1 Tax=Platanthera guangdongensis TaxID=2320717 RepID=A0ABR2LJF9_9ASPA